MKGLRLDWLSVLGVALSVWMGVAGYRIYRGTFWGEGMRLARAEISGWPASSRSLAEFMLDRRGAADEASSGRLVWTRRHPFARIAVFSDPVPWAIEQTVVYRVPRGKAQDLAELGCGVSADPDLDELTARSPSEALSLLALNLADEVARGRRDPAAARAFYEATAALAEAGKSSPYSERLMFQPHRVGVRTWEYAH